jgi:hypothetical protein
MFHRDPAAEKLPIWTYDYFMGGRDPDEYVAATSEDVTDRSRPKYILDPWKRPYVYRLTKGQDGSQMSRVCIYSVGPNGKDEVEDESDEAWCGGDDVGECWEATDLVGPSGE